MSEQTPPGLRTGEESPADVAEKRAALMLATGEALHIDVFPQLYNISAAFFYRFLPRPVHRRAPEYVYVPTAGEGQDAQDATRSTLLHTAEWNMTWEAGRLRQDMFAEKLPSRLQWLRDYEEENIYLVPRVWEHHYYAYTPLFHLLPQDTLTRHGLPLLKKGIWPHMRRDWVIDRLIPEDFDTRLSSAFASHVWPLLDYRSSMQSFSSDDPIRIIAHNLDYWLPHVTAVAESWLGAFPRVELDDEEQAQLLARVRKDVPPEFEVNRPLKGGAVWQGEEEAWEATREMVERADSTGKLRSIIDAVRSNRVQDDFSERWSFAREDFERKLYHKRAKVKVAFVELDETIPVHGPESEVDDNLIWEDFVALLDQKERRIVVCLRSGTTRVGEISRILGYANHSPVSKALARIRQKALQYLNQ